jgi:hypothetical protein
LLIAGTSLLKLDPMRIAVHGVQWIKDIVPVSGLKPNDIRRADVKKWKLLQTSRVAAGGVSETGA